MSKKRSAGQRARRHAAREQRREQELERSAAAPTQPAQDEITVPRAVSEPAAALATRWDQRAAALEGLGRLGESLIRLHQRGERLLAERDEVIDALRELDTSWNLLALRAGLSRQALIKRRRSVGGRI